MAGIFIVYNANLREIGGTDTVPATLLPAAIVKQQTFHLDMFRPLWRAYPDLARFTRFGGATQTIDEHILSSYPIGGAILATPIYAIPAWMGWLTEWRDFRVVAKITASAWVAFSAGFIFLSLRRWVAPGVALGLTVAYALGTSAWSVASQSMWQHGPGMFLLSLAVLLLQKLDEDPMASNVATIGVCLAMSVVCRPLNLIPALVFALFIVIRHREKLVAFAIPFAGIGLWLAWYNVTTFGNLSGGLSAIYHSPAIVFHEITPETAFTFPLHEGLVSTLVSPSKGFLIFSPFMIAGIISIGLALRGRVFPISRYLAAWFLLVLFVLSKNQLWWGGATYGPRYFSELTIPLILIIGQNWPRIACRPVLFASFGVAVAVSMGIQVLGAFYSPCGWDTRPEWVHLHPERLWDWRDPEILRCIQEGRARGSQAFEFLREPHPPDRDGMR